MIVEMVAAEIGEGAGRDAHAVEAMLVEPVRGGLHREMRHAFAGELVERAVQRHRIGRGERAIDLARRRDQPDGADAGGLLAERGPDLAREGGDRCLAAGAGDRRDHLRLARKELRRRRARARGAHRRPWTKATPSGSGSGGTRSAITAAAPAATAWPTKRSPSSLAPAIATNRSPGLIVRLSALMPATSSAAKRASLTASTVSRSGELHGGSSFRAGMPRASQQSIVSTAAIGSQQGRHGCSGSWH